MKNGIKWNAELALELESLFYKDSVPEEWIEIIDKLNLRWQEIAKLIGFNFADENVVKKIEDFFPVTDKKSALCIFDDAAEAINFFQNMRSINAHFALFTIRNSQATYTQSVQALIKVCCEIIDNSPIIFHQNPNIYLENMAICLSTAIACQDITYEVLKQFQHIIYELEKYQIDYENHCSNLSRGEKISESKKLKMKLRQQYFKEFEDYYQKRFKKDISRKQAADEFFQANEEKLKEIWKDGKAFYRAITERHQTVKNKARLKQQKEKNSRFELPEDISAILANWSVGD